MKEKFLANVPSIQIVSGRSPLGELIETDAWTAAKEDTNMAYLRARVDYLTRNDESRIVHTVTGHQFTTTKCNLFIITNIQISPNYIFCLLFSLSRSGLGTPHFIITRKDSPCPGIPIASIRPRTTNLAHGIKQILQTAFNTQLQEIKDKTDFLTKKHVSDHDIGHLMLYLINKNVFPPSRLPHFASQLANEKNLTGGFQSLFAVISSIYGVVISNTGPSRVMRKFSEIKESINLYMADLPQYEPTILSTNKIPDGLKL